MKKVLVMLTMLVLLSAFVSAESINLGNFPKGKWVDSNWNAVWEFGVDSVRLLDTNGNVIFDFKDKITDFKVDVSLTAAKISFTCAETQRKYLFTKATTNLDMDMKIDPDWTTTDYTVSMKFQN